MPQQVNMGATLQCSFGAAPATLIVLPVNKTTPDGPPTANIMDFKPIVNIPPFGYRGRARLSAKVGLAQR
jgi:hypothetical protein